ncbi:protein DnaJ [Seminavis robusta]|uniref:Protein DnaJ n=1 Tax=Seminavis robusta TaxID=568900 RepID=A0A9N8E299_9STRA|nr:protein DnaJ [Seminavis robusta]|eukprot:Sro472_g149940.1 protein DnaJ (202) ;mRNA; f:36190-36795
MSTRCHYESLGVAKDASLEDIKTSFRSLSKETHPDVAPHGCPKQNAERFKEISEAYRILSNSKDRRRYDLEQQDRFWYQNRSHSNVNNYQYGATYKNMQKNGQPKASGIYGVLDTIFRPRNLLMGVALGIGSTVFYQVFLVDQDAKKKLMQRQQHGNHLVEAWRNPKTGRWEQAAPWDPTYRRLQPTLELVPREQVQTRTR